jgi:hypothetical protein
MNEITLSDLTTAIASLAKDIEELTSLHSASPEILDILTSRKRQLDTLQRICDAYAKRSAKKKL